MKRIFNYKLEKNRKSPCRLFSRQKRPNYYRDVNHFLSLSLSGINERQISRCIEKHLSKNLVVADVPLCGACGRNPISCDYHCIISKGHVPSNADTLETIYFSTNQPSVHTKPVNPVTKTTLFWNRSSEWFNAPSTRIRIKKYAGLKMSRFMWTYPKSVSAEVVYWFVRGVTVPCKCQPNHRKTAVFYLSLAWVPGREYSNERCCEHLK